MKRHPQHEINRIVEELGNEGFYGDAPELRESHARLALAARGELLPEECGRIFTLDAETLYESGPDQFLAEIAPFLAGVGASMTPDEADATGEPFTFVPESDRYSGRSWQRAALRLLAALDSHFEHRRAKERSYYTHIDNDSIVAFLTPRMADLITQLADTLGSPLILHQAVTSQIRAHPVRTNR